MELLRLVFIIFTLFFSLSGHSYKAGDWVKLDDEYYKVVTYYGGPYGL